MDHAPSVSYRKELPYLPPDLLQKVSSVSVRFVGYRYRSTKVNGDFFKEDKQKHRKKELHLFFSFTSLL